VGLLDDLLARLRGEATRQAGKAATAATAAAATKAVESLADDFLGFAEGELAEARRARGLTEGEDEADAEGASGEAESPPEMTARQRREAAEARAREELARLKAAHAGGDDQQSS
jgi:parvulin-like peptidyl-prolyl isomerase